MASLAPPACAYDPNKGCDFAEDQKIGHTEAIKI